MTTTGERMCPYCHVNIIVGQAHLCPLVYTVGGIQVREKRQEVIDLARSLDAATRRIAELEAELEGSETLRMSELGKHDAEQLIRMLDAERENWALKRALERVCEGLAFALFETPERRDVATEKLYAAYVELARKELADE